MRVETKPNGKLVDVKITLDDGAIEIFEAVDFGPKRADNGHINAWAKEQAEARIEYAARPDVIAAKEAERLAREAEEAAGEVVPEIEPRIATFEELRARVEELEAFNFEERIERLEVIAANVKEGKN